MGLFSRKKKKPLTKKQRAQRKYAASMRAARTRAKSTKGGKGRLRSRSGPTKMRKKLGLK